MQSPPRIAAAAMVFALISLLVGCADFWKPGGGGTDPTTQPSPAQQTATGLSAAAALTAGTPVSPILSLLGSSLAILAAYMARSHSKDAHSSACQAGVLFQALQTASSKQAEN